ncbi:uncharacterized protein E5676_scaffold640G00250 [Cucumis melo var. makuwa]|uniref:RNase H type-1 domain-containing protein n=1 Tax=Cucumis melo var. makuwa TaxID=1194695 RepID=A0A5A7UH79_CUCMM|nr:uncharacterized protein E6C27_scaffold80G00290 [Cucumis melo var. makuwa]TYK25784.1 uncharacterized protein E5676_scaffold640G00250 [Cucumis melo var. makuwa]
MVAGIVNAGVIVKCPRDDDLKYAKVVCDQDEFCKLAVKFNLPNKDRKEPQGICFLEKYKTCQLVLKFSDGYTFPEQVFYFLILPDSQHQGLRLPGGPCTMTISAFLPSSNAGQKALDVGNGQVQKERILEMVQPTNQNPSRANEKMEPLVQDLDSVFKGTTYLLSQKSIVGTRRGEGKGTYSIKYVLSRPIISGRLAKWVVLLQQYDIFYIPQKATKGQALADFLTDYPIPLDWKLCESLPDDEVFFTEVMEPWTMYFDGAARRSGARAGIILMSPEKHMLPYSFALAKLCSNNVAEYQALIIGLQMALEIGVSLIEIYGDLKLIINQLSLQYDVKQEDLKPYFAYA